MRLATHPDPHRGRAAFGFADFLMVLATLALLTAVALPIASKNLHANRQARCTSNLKQISRALQQFADDNGGTLPAESSKQTGIWWWYRESVKGYLGLRGPSSPRDKVFVCPDDRGYEDQTPFWQRAKFDYGSYCFNGVNLPGVPNIAGREVLSIKQPAKTLLVMEWTAHAPLSWHKSRTGRKNHPFYNDAESVVGFVDGHVDMIKIYYDGMNAAYTRDPIPGYSYKYSGD